MTTPTKAQEALDALPLQAYFDPRVKDQYETIREALQLLHRVQSGDTEWRVYENKSDAIMGTFTKKEDAEKTAAACRNNGAYIRQILIAAPAKPDSDGV